MENIETMLNLVQSAFLTYIGEMTKIPIVEMIIRNKDSQNPSPPRINRIVRRKNPNPIVTRFPPYKPPSRNGTNRKSYINPCPTETDKSKLMTINVQMIHTK